MRCIGAGMNPLVFDGAARHARCIGAEALHVTPGGVLLASGRLQ